MGKSTAGDLLRRDGAHGERVVLLAHAEAYLPGRLAALAADAISEMIAEDLPTATGRQALTDRDVTLIIDGASEVPEEVRQGLAAELLAPLAGGRGAQIMLLGREMALLRATFPSSRLPAVYQLVELDEQRRLDLACRLMWGSAANDPQNAGRLPRLRGELARMPWRPGHRSVDRPGRSRNGRKQRVSDLNGDWPYASARKARRWLGEPASGLDQLLLASARLWSRSAMLRYENLLSILLARVAGYGHDLVALLGFCHDICLHLISAAGIVSGRQRPFTTAEY